MAAIMEFTRYSNAIADTYEDSAIAQPIAIPVLRTFISPNHVGTIFIQIAGAPRHKVGDIVTYSNPANGVQFTGKVWYIYKSATNHNLYVKHPDANVIGTNTGGVVYTGSAVPKAYNPEAPGSGTGSAADELHAQEEGNADLPTPSPTMSSVLPAGWDIKKVGIGVAILAVAWYIFKGKKGKK